jgi:hypothetical protein
MKQSLGMEIQEWIRKMILILHLPYKEFSYIGNPFAQLLIQETL